MEYLSAAAISVNITPTIELFLYHPVTSVSRVASDNAETILLKTLPFLSAGRQVPVSIKGSKNGFRERCDLFLSSEIIL
jgi:hypothetical protein